MARTLDIGGTFTQYNTLPTPQLADAVAMRADLQAVGDDMRKAMALFAAQLEMSSNRIEQEATYLQAESKAK